MTKLIIVVTAFGLSAGIAYLLGTELAHQELIFLGAIAVGILVGAVVGVVCGYVVYRIVRSGEVIARAMQPVQQPQVQQQPNVFVMPVPGMGQQPRGGLSNGATTFRQLPEEFYPQ